MPRAVHRGPDARTGRHRSEAARAAARDTGADGCLAIGGGSTIGLGKAIALTTGLPVISVPTTYAGSEMTPVWGLTDNGRKRTGRDRAALPRSVVYDPELTLRLPVDTSVTSGFNAIAHAVEALYAPDAYSALWFDEADALTGFRAWQQALTGHAERHGAHFRPSLSFFLLTREVVIFDDLADGGTAG